MMTQRLFTLEELDAFTCVPEAEERHGKNRWSENVTVIFRADDDKFYRVETEEGNTEYQDYYGSDRYPDMDYGDTELLCQEVEPYEDVVVVTKWRAV